MEEITKYKTVDGAIFNRKLCAIAYENLIDETVAIISTIGYDYEHLFKFPIEDRCYRIVGTQQSIAELKEKVWKILMNTCKIWLYDNGWDKDIEQYKERYKTVSMQRFVDLSIPKNYECIRSLSSLILSIDDDGREFTSFRARCDYEDNYPDKSVWREIKEWEYWGV